MDEDDDYEIGYKKPPKSGQIKKGERRNPSGRRGKGNKLQPSVKRTDAEILAMLDNELVEFKGRRITKRQAELMVLQARSLQGDMKAHQILDNLRKKLQSERPAKGGGVLVVPVVGSLREWSIEAAIQQAKFRGEDPEGLAELEAYGKTVKDEAED